jgi:hypothetical protein
MKIVETEQGEPVGEVVQLKTKDAEDRERLPIETVLDNCKNAEFVDVIVIGRKADGDMALSMSAETGILAYYMIRRALFAVEHGMM